MKEKIKIILEHYKIFGAKRNYLQVLFRLSHHKDSIADELCDLSFVRERISRVDLEDYADQYINDRYRTLDHTIWGNEMESDRKIFMEGMKRIYYAL